MDLSNSTYDDQCTELKSNQFQKIISSDKLTNSFESAQTECKAPSLGFRHNPEFCVLREQIHTSPNRDSTTQDGEESIKQKKISFYDYHKLHPYLHDQACNEFNPPPISEDEFKFLCSEIPDPMWNSTFCVERIYNIVTSLSVMTAEQIHGSRLGDTNESQFDELLEKRLVELFKFYQIKSPCGLFVQDGSSLKNALQVLATGGQTKLQDRWPFLRSLVELIFDQFGKGFFIQNTSDLVYLDGLQEVFSYFGVLVKNYRQDLWLSEKSIRVLEQLIERYRAEDTEDGKLQKCQLGSVKSAKKCPSSQREIDKYSFFKCIEGSELVPRLIQLIMELSTPTSDCPFYENIVGMLTNLINSSPKLRKLALAFPILNPILLQLKEPDEGCKMLCRAVELIYSLLAKPIEEVNGRIRIAPCSEEAFEILLFRFLQRIRHISSKHLVDLRNDVAFAVYLLAKHIPVLGQKFSRHAFVIAGIISNNVMCQENIPFVLDATTEDLEFLQILLSILQLIISNDQKAEEIATKYELVSVLVRILIGPCSMLEAFEEDDALLQQIIQCTWKTLTSITTKFPLLLLNIEGVDAVLNVLQIFVEFGQLEMNTIAILLDVLRNLLSHESQQDEIVTYLVGKNATSILTGVLDQLVKREHSIAEEPTLCNCLICCAILTGYDQYQRDVFLQENGVKILALLLYKLNYLPAYSRHMNPILQIAVTECVWKSLTDSLGSLEMFVVYEGIFRMLDLLEIAAGPTAQLHILSCLVELCQYSRCVGQLLHWKRSLRDSTKRQSHTPEFMVPPSRNGCSTLLKPQPGDVFGDVIMDHDLTLSALLCELWRNEETRFGCARDKRGVIASLDNPLMSEFSSEYKQKRLLVGESNGPASLDLICSIRPKIYLLVKKIIETTNTEATVFGSLSLPNQLTMQIIINFLDLKRGEIWLEMIDELKAENIKLVESDEIAIKRFKNISHNKVCTVIDTQRYLIQRAKEHDEMHEREFYNVIQQCHFQNHLLALREADFFARTSNYFLLVEKRLWQKAQLERAVRSVNSNARIHRTTDDKLNITVWPGRNKMVISEPQFNADDIEKESSVMSTAMSSASLISESNVSFFGGLGGIGFGGTDTMVDGRLVVTRTRTEEGTIPGSGEEGSYEISPIALRKALLIIALEQKKWNWSDLDEDQAWRMRTKWKMDWYP